MCGVNVCPAAVRDVIASFAPSTNGVIEIQLHEAPPKGWEPPVHIKAKLVRELYREQPSS